MTDKPAPRLTEKARADKAAREARAAEALRANLHRRKQQARARAVPDPQSDAPKSSG